MKICFVYLGPLRYRGRLFKQIKTLQNAGHECLLIHGRTEETIPDYSAYTFSVIPFRVIQEKNKLMTLVTQIYFNFRVAKEISKIEPDSIVCLALGGALSGALAKKKNSNIQFCYDCNELFLESTKSKLKKIVWGKIQARVLKYADIIFHAETNRMQYFNEKYPSKAISVLLENLPYYQKILPSPKVNNNYKCVYLGILTPGRYIEEMITAFASKDLNSLTLDIIGFGSKDYEKHIAAICKEKNIKNVRLLPPVPHNEIYKVLKNYDIGMAFYRNINLNNYYCAPNKVYDYIQLGIPVLTNDFPGLKNVVEYNNIGICISEVNELSIKTSINTIIDNNIKLNIDDSIRHRFSWENQVDRYRDVFENYSKQKGAIVK